MLITPDGMSTEAELSRPLSRCATCGKTNDRVCGECTCKKQEPEPSEAAIAEIHAANALSDEEIAEQFGHASAEPPKPMHQILELPRPDTSTPPPPGISEDYVLTFGVHKGKALAQVLIDKASYLVWLQKQSWLRYPLREHLNYMMEKYAVDIERNCEAEQQQFYRSRRR
jgi:hypothetical protein